MENVLILSAFKDLIFKLCGSEYHRVEVSDDQFTALLNKAKQIYVEKHFDGSTRSIYELDVSSGEMVYTLPDYVDSVVSIINLGTLNSPVSVRKLMYEANPSMFNKDLVQYAFFQGYLEQQRITYGLYYHWDYTRTSKRLTLLSDPETDNIFLEIFKDNYIDDAEDIYEDHIFRDMCQALCLIQWSRNLKKYERALIGNSTLNWKEIEEDGKTLWEETLEKIDTEYCEEPEIEFG